jgi:hypothetical protein
MRIVTIKSILWFFTILLLVLSFPIQVYLNSPIPSLFSYAILVILFALTGLQKDSLATRLFKWSIGNSIEQVIFIFIFLLILHSVWQTLFGFITIGMAFSSYIIFAFPVLFYIYFRNALTDKELRYILFTMAIAGLIVGTYFAYDSISKLLYGILPDYALKAREYSFNRGGGTIQGYYARVDLAGRSMGLLEKHAVSSAWIGIGCFAALALIPVNAIKKRAFIISLYGILLVLGMNFTGILGFILVVLLIEMGLYRFFIGFISRRSIKIFIGFLIVFAAIFFLTVSVFGSDLVKIMQKFIDIQYDIAVGKRAVYDGSKGYFGGMMTEITSFPVNMWKKFPPGLLIGDGFSPGWKGVVDKGGDYGFIETMYRLGPPMFLIVFVGLLIIVRKALKKVFLSRFSENHHSDYLQFANSVIIYLIFSELHYTIWSAKSIFPVFFLCLAIYNRYLPVKYLSDSAITQSPPVPEV